MKTLHRRRKFVAEVNRLPSMTEPEQVTPLQKLLEHRGTNVPIPIFNGVFSERDTPDIDRMDFVDIAQLRDETALGIEMAKEDYHALTVKYEELRKKEYDEAVKRAQQAQQASVDASNNTP